MQTYFHIYDTAHGGTSIHHSLPLASFLQRPNSIVSRAYFFFHRFLTHFHYLVFAMSSFVEFVAPVAAAGSSKHATSLLKELTTPRTFVLVTSIAVAGLFLYFICNFIYNVYFHPYAKYPGPFLAKFTDLYAGYHAWKGDIHLDMWRCHQVYGDKVRYAPNRLNVNTVTGLKSEFKTRISIPSSC